MKLIKCFCEGSLLYFITLLFYGLIVVIVSLTISAKLIMLLLIMIALWLLGTITGISSRRGVD